MTPEQQCAMQGLDLLEKTVREYNYVQALGPEEGYAFRVQRLNEIAEAKKWVRNPGGDTE